LNIFFDVQGTLISGGSPRPEAREVFQELEDLGHHLYLWSSGGSAYCAQAAELLDVEDIAYGYFSKSGSLPVTVDFAVDDQPHLLEEYGGHKITPFDGNPDDKELWKVVEKLK
jgi:predicted mannosyl-3-phosphoglycerate phosphatase (HAD superfamily)